MRSKSVLLLTLALGCGLVASIGISQVIDKRNNQEPVAGETEAVLVAMADIGFNEQLTAQNIKVEAWPKGKVPAGVATKIEDVEKKRTRMRIFAGEPILQAKLLGPGDSNGVAPEIPKGYRVVSVRVDAVAGTAGLIEPGNRVDVLVYFTRNPSVGIEKTTTRTVLQDIAVFAVDTITITKRQNDKDEQPTTAKTVSLLVQPDQAQRITLASELGQIRLVLRGVGDTASVADNGSDVEELLRGMGSKGDKNRENDLPDKPAVKKGGGSGLLAVIAEAIKKAPPGKPGEPVSEAWKMMVMRGPEISLVEFADANALPLNLLPGSPAADPAAPTVSPAAPDDSAAAPADSPPLDQPDGDQPFDPTAAKAARQPQPAPAAATPASATKPAAPTRPVLPPGTTSRPVAWPQGNGVKPAAGKSDPNKLDAERAEEVRKLFEQ